MVIAISIIAVAALCGLLVSCARERAQERRAIEAQTTPIVVWVAPKATKKQEMVAFMMSMGLSAQDIKRLEAIERDTK